MGVICHNPPPLTVGRSRKSQECPYSAFDMNRPYNFSAGPATLPLEVLNTAASEMHDWHGSGMSVMEMSHRGKEFGQIYEQTQADLRDRETHSKKPDSAQ